MLVVILRCISSLWFFSLRPYSVAPGVRNIQHSLCTLEYFINNMYLTSLKSSIFILYNSLLSCHTDAVHAIDIDVIIGHANPSSNQIKFIYTAHIISKRFRGVYSEKKQSMLN